VARKRSTLEDREKHFKAWIKRHRDGDLKQYLFEIGRKIRALARDCEVVLKDNPVRYYEHQKHRDSLREDCEVLRGKLDRLIVDLTKPPPRIVYPKGDESVRLLT
jgi:hypothetical protein